ncbi:MAG TPA: SHOCT domain-containing protein, partial [Candidatus Saccharimonadales bacterium]|nr:SHOCT domain-containing protein [Candidatus Saccharimonadales bacterium]
GTNVIFSHSNRFIDEASFKGMVSTAFAQVKGAFVKPAQENGTTVGIAEQIEKYADLLQKGAITQAEYDAKKKQLLDL